MRKERKFSGFDVALTTGSSSKKLLANSLTIRVPSERSDVEVRLTTRQARALQKFLDDHLDMESDSLT